MARAPKIGPLNPPAKHLGNSVDRRVETSGRQSERPCSSTWLRRPGTAPGAQLSPSNSILAGLPREELNHLKPRLQRVSWHSGQVLTEVATPLDCFHFPESGMVCRFAVLDDGRTVAWRQSDGRVFSACPPSSEPRARNCEPLSSSAATLSSLVKTTFGASFLSARNSQPRCIATAAVIWPRLLPSAPATRFIACTTGLRSGCSWPTTAATLTRYRSLTNRLANCWAVGVLP
jgi:hypothetical protein